jgi:hypothetical protein
LKIFLKIIHPIISLLSEQVSEANLRSKQGGINFTRFVLSIRSSHVQKQNKNPLWIGIKSKCVCLLSICLSVCLSVCPSVFLIYSGALLNEINWLKVSIGTWDQIYRI